jgi:hypothetical protein
VSGAETYLRELRRALPLGCRRRLVAEMREHFVSAAETGEPEHLTIERLGPARALAEQLLADMRSGALGRIGRLRAAATTSRLVASASLVVLAIVAGALFAGRQSSPAQPARQRMVSPTVWKLDPKTGEIRAIIFAATKVQEKALTTSRHGGPVLVQWEAVTPARPSR